MNKLEFLQELKDRFQKKEISKQEILDIINIKESVIYKLSLNTVLYILGVIIVLIGVIVFLNRVWVDLPSFFRIFITLGLGMGLTLNAVLLQKKNKGIISIIFYFIGGVMNFIGSLVLIYELNKNFFAQDKELLIPVIVFLMISLFYIIINYSMKQAVLTFFSLFNASILFLLTYLFVLEDNNTLIQDTIFMVFVIIGLIYLLFSKYFENTFNKYLIPLTNVLGTVFVLSGTISKVESGIWQFLYVLISIGFYTLSLYLKSRWILVINTLFLAGFIVYITGKYFASSLGWPLSLIILGFIFIGLGYFSVNLNKKLKV